MKLEVFIPDLTPIGSIDAFSALRWTERYNKCGSFELWCPALKDNVEVLKENNLLWLGGLTCGIIEVVQSSVKDDNTTEINIRGRLAEGYLSYRAMLDTYLTTAKNVSDVMREIININCINPTDPNRKIPNLILKPDQQVYGDKITFQRTGTDILSMCEETASAHNLGFSLEFFPHRKVFEFTINKGVDRTMGQNIVPPVIFSTETEDILASSYFYNQSEYKNVALVAGAGEGAERKKVFVGSGAGLERRELYVDARDLQNTKEDGGLIPDQEYSNILNQRGLEYLAEKQIVQSFDATIKSFGDMQYTYGIDYTKGDLVTVQDKNLGLIVNARVTEVERVYDQNGESLNLVFGYAQPTLNQKLKFLGLGV